MRHALIEYMKGVEKELHSMLETCSVDNLLHIQGRMYMLRRLKKDFEL